MLSDYPGIVVAIHFCLHTNNNTWSWGHFNSIFVPNLSFLPPEVPSGRSNVIVGNLSAVIRAIWSHCHHSVEIWMVSNATIHLPCRKGRCRTRTPHCPPGRGRPSWRSSPGGRGASCWRWDICLTWCGAAGPRSRTGSRTPCTSCAPSRSVSSPPRPRAETLWT